MVSSGVYRYFASRDEFLTALIMEAYDAIGAEADGHPTGMPERGTRPVAGDLPSDPPVGPGPSTRVGPRLRFTGPRLRGAARHVVPAQRVTGRWSPSPPMPHATAVSGAESRTCDVPARLATSSPDRRAIDGDGALTTDDLVRLLTAWSQVFGIISLELFGQTARAITAHEALFEATATTLGRLIGLVRAEPGAPSSPGDRRRPPVLGATSSAAGPPDKDTDDEPATSSPGSRTPAHTHRSSGSGAGTARRSWTSMPARSTPPRSS